MSEQVLLGETPARVVYRQRTRDEMLKLSGIRSAQDNVFATMHDVLPFQRKGLFSRSPIKSFVTHYEHASVPHNAVMAGWVERSPSSRYAQLFTQMLENVGEWLPAGEPRVRAETMNRGRIAIEGFTPERFETLDLDYQVAVVDSVLGVVENISAGHNVLVDFDLSA